MGWASKRVRLGLVSGLLGSWAIVTGTLLAQQPGLQRLYQLRPGPQNPRNSEGDFIRLRDGRLLFVYSRFRSGSSDFSSADLAAVVSSDEGRTWTPWPRLIVPNEGRMNVMSVSLLRLQNGQIALFYVRKNSLKDCRPWVRFSSDEAQTWSEPVPVIRQPVGYYVLNNDRVVQLSSGRLVVPVALHNLPHYEKPDWQGEVMCYLSDDQGRSWRRSRSVLRGYNTQGKRVLVQEPGVVELPGGKLLMYCRTNAGVQYYSVSRDGGETWSPLRPWTLVSPVSPATVKRIPGTDVLLAVWNDHSRIDPSLRGKRTPLVVAVSYDQGNTWVNRRMLEDDPTGWYCYTAVEFVGPWVFLAYCSGSTKKYARLSLSQLSRFQLAWVLDRP